MSLIWGCEGAGAADEAPNRGWSFLAWLGIWELLTYV